MRGFFFLFLLAVPAWAEPGFLEVWVHNPNIRIADVVQTHTDAAKDFGSGVQATQVTDSLEVRGIVWDGSALRVDSLKGAVKVGELKATAQVVVPITLFSLANLELEARTRQALTFTFPDRIAFRGAGLADENFKQNIDAQIDALFSQNQVDRIFEIAPLKTTTRNSLSTEGAKLLNGLLQSQKGQILEQARQGLKKALTGETLISLTFPSLQEALRGLPERLARRDYILQKQRTTQGVVWRLALVNARPTDASLLNASGNNSVSVVMDSGFVAEVVSSSLENSDFQASWKQEIGTLPESEGERAPRVRFWKEPRTSAARLDVMLCTRDAGREDRLGTIWELDSRGTPRLLRALPLGVQAQGAQAAQPDAEGLAQVLTPIFRFVADSPKLEWVGLQTLGDGGQRQARNAAQGRWTNYLVYQYRLRP